MHQAMYRKWRPMRFEDVIGQEHVTKTLKTQSASGRLSHAYLFCGPRGTGKTTCARILAKAVNCAHAENGDPCNKCPSCVGINEGSITDIIEMDAATYTGVDDIRALRDEALYSPSELTRKVYIIDEVHMLSPNAFNAFLKILEEPPAHIMFILASTEIQKIPATILSRCQRFEFRRISRLEIAKKLTQIAKAENIPLTDSGASLIAHIADGAMRNALNLLEQAASRRGDALDGDAVAASLGLAGAAPLLDICESVASGDSAAALERFSALYASGVEPAAFCDQMLCLMRDIMVLRENGDFKMLGSGYTEDDLKVFFGVMPRAKALNSVKILRDCLFDMGRSPNKRIDMEMCLIRLCDRSQSQSSSFGSGGAGDRVLEERLAALESLINSGKIPPRRESRKSSADGEEPDTDEKSRTDTVEKGEEQPCAIKYRDELVASLRESLDMVTLSHLKLCSFMETDGKIIVKTEDPMTFGIINRRRVLDEVALAAGKIKRAVMTAAAEKNECGADEALGGLDELFRFAQENPDIARMR